MARISPFVKRRSLLRPKTRYEIRFTLCTLLLSYSLSAWGCAPAPALREGEPSFKNAREYDGWQQRYYRHPQPDLFPASVEFINHLESDLPRFFPTIAFYCELFKRHPERLPDWIARVSTWELRPVTESVIWLSLKCADSPEARRLLYSYFEKSSGARQEAIHQAIQLNLVAKHPRDPAVPYFGEEVLLPQDLDRLWVRWFATGDPKYVLVVIAALDKLPELQRDEKIPSTMPIMIGIAARWSLLANARQNPDVLHIIKQKFAHTEPGKVRRNLELIVNEAEKAHRQL